MIGFVLSLPTWPGLLVTIALITGLGIGFYIISHELIKRYAQHDLKNPANSLTRIVGLFVSLILSLGFADVISELETIKKTISLEVVAISDCFYDLQHFDDDQTRDIRVMLVEYVQAVIDHDWQALADDRLSQTTGSLLQQISTEVMALQPVSPIQEKLWSKILDNVDKISDYRIIRLVKVLTKHPVFVYAVIIGFLTTMVCFGPHQPQPALFILLILYSSFVGLMLFLILALSDPFQGHIGVSPDTFELLIESLQFTDTRSGLK